MWIIKKFKTRQQMTYFIERQKHRIQWNECFINHSSLKQVYNYAIEYRLLRRVY